MFNAENEKGCDGETPDARFLSAGQGQESPDDPERRSTMSRRSGIDRRKANMLYTGLDIEKGIERFNGERSVYFKVLESYTMHMRQLLDVIENVSVDKLVEYSVVVQNIKDSSHGIFADMIGDAAENLGTAAENGDFCYVSAHNRTFLNTAWKLIFDLEDLLANTSSSNPKPFRDKPDDETLSKLLRACKSYNMDGVDEAMTELERYQYRSGGDLAAWLIYNIKMMNFKEIVEKLLSIGLESGVIS